MGEINVEEEDIPNHYRTFSIPLTSHDFSQTLDDDRVHGWMLGDKTCLMVPNQWGFASGVFIYPREDDPFQDMDVDDPQAVQSYIHELSPNSLSKFVGPDEALDMISRPYNYASTARVDRLHARDCVLFLGDSAHAVSASVGQACNAALQDVAKFNEVLDETNDHWHRSLLKFTERRLKDVLALHELSDYSLPNPKDRWIQTEFIFRAITRKVLPTFITRHMAPMPNELLSTTNLSYSEILEQTEWWTEKVKRSMQVTNNGGGGLKRSPKSGDISGLKRSPKSDNISLLVPSNRKMVRVS
jgi:kynurenine 3-monooxygenase